MNEQERLAAVEEACDRQAAAIKPFMDYCREELHLGERFFVSYISVVPDGDWYDAKFRFKALKEEA